MAKDTVSKKPVRPVVKQQAKEPKKPATDRAKGWLKGVQGELRKVTWPTRKETINYTIIVVVMTLLLALSMGLFDLFFQQLFFYWL